MHSTNKGIGRFTAENIVAIMKAIPETNGTYESVANHANQYGAEVNAHTIAKWVTSGNADIRHKKSNTAYARFAKKYLEMTGKHCGPDENRNRELDRAISVLNNQCECGNEKEILPNGRLARECTSCRELDLRRQRAA